ncbi:MAG: DEAD/DEAH box helicase [Planctomycetota bacterium]
MAVMFVLHAIWSRDRLQLWGVRKTPSDRDPSKGESPRVGEGESFPASPGVLSHRELNAIAGDVWDSLLIADATEIDCTVFVPDPTVFGNASSLPDTAVSIGSVTLHALVVPALSFDAADAVDLLTAHPVGARSDIALADSVVYWSKVAWMMLELLAKQQFAPALHQVTNGLYRGCWRPIVTQPDFSERLQELIPSMPPACRAFGPEPFARSPAQWVEDFLLHAADAVIRRLLAGDDLTHALRVEPDEEWSPQMWWLRSLVHSDENLGGDPSAHTDLRQAVRTWLSKLDPAAIDRPFKTCLELETPPVSDMIGHPAKPNWRLRVWVQESQAPSRIISGTDLNEVQPNAPVLLEKPFAVTKEQVRADLRNAARHFAPLAPLAEPDGPWEAELSTDEAYQFLREATPLLLEQGIDVRLPKWWSEERPKLRMHLSLDPESSGAGVGESALPLQALVNYNWRVALGNDDLTAEELADLAAEKAPLVQVRGHWIEVRPSDLHVAVGYLRENSRGSTHLIEALRRYYLADETETGLPIAELRATGWLEEILDPTTLRTTYAEAQQPKGFTGTLRPYQQRGLGWFRFLAGHRLGACLADDMGLGKTVQLIAFWLSERESEEICGPTLLVVPMSLVGNWQRELSRFGPSLRVMVHHGLERLSGEEFIEQAIHHDVVISTYGLAHRDFEHLAAVEWHRVALDEAQNIKNPAAKQSVALRSLRATHRVVLTGTPLENRLSELWSILDFLNPGYLGNASDFRRRFAVPIERNHDADRAQRLRLLIRPFVLRRLKNDPSVQLDLPDKLEMKVYCNLTREQAALYEAVVSDMLGQVNSAGGIQRRGLILATLVKLKQVCNHPVHFLADDTSLPERSGKCNRIAEMLEEVVAEGHRALIFTQFKVMGSLLLKLLEPLLNCSILFLHGGTKQKERDALVERFQSGDPKTPILMLSLKAGGVGLNLTSANHVFHFDRWWNPAVEDQATDRAHRIGQEKQVLVHKLVCIGTLEERIDQLMERKRNLADRIIGGGEEWLTELSTDALRELITLSKEAVSED